MRMSEAISLPVFSSWWKKTTFASCPPSSMATLVRGKNSRMARELATTS